MKINTEEFCSEIEWIEKRIKMYDDLVTRFTAAANGSDERAKFIYAAIGAGAIVVALGNLRAELMDWKGLSE